MDISKITSIGRKQWVQRRWDDYEASSNTKVIERSIKAYYEPTDKDYDNRMDKSKWKSTVERKINYLLARNPIVDEHQDILDELISFIRESALAYMLRGALIWIVQGNGEEVNPRPLIMNNTIAVYGDEYREDILAYIRKYTELEIDEMSGEETEVNYYECYYQDGEVWKRDTYCYTLDNKDKEEILVESPVFIQLGKTGDAPLYAYVEKLLEAYDNILNYQDKTVVKNTSPLTEVKGYTGTDDADLKYAIDELSIVKVDGNGGVTLHVRSMDSASVDVWMKRLLTEYYEATATVGKETELQYAQSGKAMDRLFVDMENSARQLAEVLEKALVEYFEVLGYDDVDIIWNTDRPIDDMQIISSIQISRGLLSDRTLIEQHPWVEDVEEEMKRREAEVISGMDDLYEEEYNDEDEWEVSE